jgi:hypothetical protein
VRAYDRALAVEATYRDIRVGLPANLMRPIVTLGLTTPVVMLIRDEALVIIMFMFGCRASTAGGVRESDVSVTSERVTAVLVHRKGKRTQDPLVLSHYRNPAAAFPASFLALLQRWSAVRPTTDVYFALAVDSVDLGDRRGDVEEEYSL